MGVGTVMSAALKELWWHLGEFNGGLWQCLLGASRLGTGENWGLDRCPCKAPGVLGRGIFLGLTDRQWPTRGAAGSWS